MSAYYQNGSSTTTGEDYAGVYHFGPNITCGEAGNITSLEVWTHGTGNIKIALYNASTRARLHSGGTASLNASGGWSAVDISGSAYACTLNQVVVVGWQADATAEFYQEASGGKYESGDYADFPVATLSEYAGDGTAYRARVYVTAASAGRTTKNTRSFPLGIAAGMNRRM